MILLSHTVPLLRWTAVASILILPACYASHGAWSETDVLIHPPIDGATLRPDTAPVLDAPFISPPAPACPLRRADASCLSSFAMIAGRPFELPFQFDDIPVCCGETSCDVTVDAASRTLHLVTGLCPDLCDCEPIHTPRGTCSVPALPVSAVGQWTVEVNDVPAFTIGLVPDEPGLIPIPAGCATYAEVDECGGATPDFTTGPVTGDICVQVQQYPDREVLTLSSRCWGCGQLDSECQVIVNRRLTDDLPFGSDITLLSRDYPTDCDVDCPEICALHQRECALPPLDPGTFNRVFVDGRIVHEFTEGGPGTTCEP